MEYYSVLKRREIQSHATTWMHLEDNMLSKISQSQKTNTVKYKVSKVGSTGVKESVCQCMRHKRHRFDPWVGKMPWRRNWQPTPVFLPGKSMDRGAWQSIVYRDTKSQTEQLSTDAWMSSQIHGNRKQNVVARIWEEGQMRKCCLIQSFSFAKWKILEICCTALWIYLALLNCTYKNGQYGRSTFPQLKNFFEWTNPLNQQSHY